MKFLLSILVATALLTSPTAYGQRGGQNERGNRVTFNDVMISSVLTKVENRPIWKFDGKVGAQGLHFVINDNTKFVTIVNGKRIPVSPREGRSKIVVGSRIAVNGKQTPKGIIAVLIAL